VSLNKWILYKDLHLSILTDQRICKAILLIYINKFEEVNINNLVKRCLILNLFKIGQSLTKLLKLKTNLNSINLNECLMHVPLGEEIVVMEAGHFVPALHDP